MNRLALILVELVLFSLGIYRVWRYVGEDTFPPIKAVRDHFLRKWGPDSWKTEGLLCPYCAGGWLVFLTYAVAAQVIDVPWPILQAFACQTLVGLLGHLDVA